MRYYSIYICFVNSPGMLCIVAVLRECGTYLVMTVQMVGVMMPAWCPRFTSEEPSHSHTK